MVTPHSDADKIKQLYDNPASVSTVENDIWTPYVSTKGVTAGIFRISSSFSYYGGLILMH